MKMLRIKSFLKKLTVVIMIITALNLKSPKRVEASADFAGKLVEPIVDLVVWLGDGAMDIVHHVILDQSSSVIRVDLTNSTGKKILAFLAGVAIGIGAAILVVATAGLAAAAFAAIRVNSWSNIRRYGYYGSCCWSSIIGCCYI